MMQRFKYQIYDHLPRAVAPPLVATQGNRAEEEEQMENMLQVLKDVETFF